MVQTVQDYYNKAKAEFSKGRAEEAASHLKQCYPLLRMTPDPKMINLTSTLARDVACMMGKYQEAIRFTNLLLAHPNISEADKTHNNFMLGQMYFALQDYEKARSFLRQPKVRESYGDSPDYNFKCEFIRVLLDDDVKDTLDSYSKKVACNPESTVFLQRKFFLSFLFRFVTTQSIKTPDAVFKSEPSIHQDYQKLVQQGHPIDDILASVTVLA